MDKKLIGYRITAMRTDLGLSLMDLTEVTGIDHTTISRIENGIRLVTTPNLISLAKAFEVTTDYILFGVDCKAHKE